MKYKWDKEVEFDSCPNCHTELITSKNKYVVCVNCLLDELERLQAESAWHKYPDEKPEDGGLIYQVILEENGNEWCEHEYYSFNDGWATDKNVLWYRPVPNTPSAPDAERSKE